ncbi:MAG: efflux RND transporter periplasmic adaptor subunit, partial [Cyanobacteria bacterium]|nr:efflux RND transporter periplasmic adaptor subunit [Cyanobacteriota bacterium]
ISQQKYDEMKEQYQNAQSVLESAQANLKVLKSGSRPEQVSIARSQLASVKAQYQKLVKGAKKEELEIANATIEQAQSVLTALEAQLSELSITAPIDGMITILSVNEGELVSPNRPVVSIIDYSHLWSDIFIQESSLNQVKIGQTVRVTAPAYPKSIFTGHVVFVSPKSEFVPNGNGSSPTEQSSFRVKINIDYWDSTHAIQLHPGMKVTVFFNEAA